MAFRVYYSTDVLISQVQNGNWSGISQRTRKSNALSAWFCIEAGMRYSKTRWVRVSTDISRYASGGGGGAFGTRKARKKGERRERGGGGAGGGFGSAKGRESLFYRLVC